MSIKERKLLEQLKSYIGNNAKRLALQGLIVLIYCSFWPVLYQGDRTTEMLFFVFLCLSGINVGIVFFRMSIWILQWRKVRKEIRRSKAMPDEESEEKRYERLVGQVPSGNKVLATAAIISLIVILPVMLLFISGYWQNTWPSPKRISSGRYARGKTSQRTKDKSSEDSHAGEENITYVRRSLAAGSEKTYADIPSYNSAEEWMTNRTIPAQVLYEDETFRLEIEECTFRDGDLIIPAVFTNNSDHTVSAATMSRSLYVNDIIKSAYVIYSYELGDNVMPGKQKKTEIKLSEDEIFPFDPYLEKIEFRMNVWDGKDYSPKPENLYLETEPIIIRTEPSVQEEQEGRKDEAFDVVMSPGMKVLYENEDVRIIRTGVDEHLTYEDGKLGSRYSLDGGRSTYWKFLVENRTRNDLVIDHRTCTINGEKALSDRLGKDWLEVDDPEPGLLDEDNRVEINRMPKVVSAGRRKTFFYRLERNAEEHLQADSDGKEQTSSGSCHVRLESWPLEEIRSGYAGYTVHYTDHAGQEQSIRIEDSFTR